MSNYNNNNKNNNNKKYDDKYPIIEKYGLYIDLAMGKNLSTDEKMEYIDYFADFVEKHPTTFVFLKGGIECD